MKVIIIYGGNSSEKQISIKTGISVNRGLEGIFETKMVMVNDNYKVIKDYYKKDDVVFNCLHGGYGEDGEIQSFFENEKIKFIGSGSHACSLAIDKLKSKKIAKSLKCAVPNGRILKKTSEFEEFEAPFIVKPNNEGSSVGFFEIYNKKDLKAALKANIKHNGDLLAEEKIEGRELTVSILNGKALPIVEIIPHEKVYDYNSKYNSGKTSYVVPANIDKLTSDYIVLMSEKIFSKMKCRHYARIDYMLSFDNDPYFLELNTYPGMTDSSLFPKSAKSAGMTFQDLMKKLVFLSTCKTN